jgi:ABC-type multidrug transport system permease subunit
VRALLAVVAKDLRLLWNDRAALVFIALAPIIVITVAGLSLANLYGADPTGQTAYELPVVDEDGSALSGEIVAALEREPAVRVSRIATRDEALVLVRDRKRAGTALVIPKGTEAALRDGRDASLVLYTDAVKYLERLNVRLRLGALVDAAAEQQSDALAKSAEQGAAEVGAQRDRLEHEIADSRAAVDHAYAEARASRAKAAAEIQTALDRALAGAQQACAAAVESELGPTRDAARDWMQRLGESRHAFEAWLAALAKRAGSHAGDIPPPPAIPDAPPAVVQWLAAQPPPLRAAAKPIALPPLPALPELPPLPAIDLPAIDLPASPHLPGRLRIEETDVSGGGSAINTFEQNVPGFSVTFLLLGMLLGVSLGLLDEQEWGTLERLQSLPIGLPTVLGGKLVARFGVGVLQMLLLFAVGKAAFSISFGPEPWALLLPIVGIVFAGVAIGLVVAALAPTREAVLPVGSAVIITMAAMGGCWWPIDLEPRWMRHLALAFPTTWAMDAFNDLMIRRRGLDRALLPTGVLLAFGAFYLALGIALFRLRLERARR